MAITSAGIGSGLDIESLVSQLVAAEGQPAVNRLNRKEASFQGELSAFGALKAALTKFQDAVKGLQNPEDFLGRKASSSNDDLFSATADSSAVAGSYQIEIEQLAQAAKVSTSAGDFSSRDDVVGTGSLTINLGSESFTVNVDETNNTLEGLMKAINDASDNPGITATIISTDSGTNLILSSDKVGSSNAITTTAVDDNGADGFDLGRFNAAENNANSQAAKDAIIYVDNQQVTRSSNSFSDVIEGVTFNLQKAEAGKLETLTVTRDEGAVKNKINAFISAYNALVDTTSKLSSYNADTGAAGALLGDSALRGVQSAIRQTITSAVSGLEFGTLAEIGVTTNDANKLTLDSEKLNEVLANDFSSISELFASENGLAKQLDSVLERYAGSDGVLDARTDGLQSRIDSIGDDREQLGRRLEALEARYRAQFTAMDVLVGQLSSIGNFLTQQLANVPQPGARSQG